MSHDSKLAGMRREYSGPPLTKESVAGDPFAQFTRWFDEVVAQEVPIGNGMTLATVDADGQPSARIVLLKSFDERGFVFFTNYGSRKGRELGNNPKAALLFWWEPLQRQIRIEGEVERVSDAESDAYFASRPRASNLSAMASPQSQPIPNRQWLQQRVAQLREQWAGKELERPPLWGGYRLIPRYFEFWQGRTDRMHDRVCYRLQRGGTWQLECMAP